MRQVSKTLYPAAPAPVPRSHFKTHCTHSCDCSRSTRPAVEVVFFILYKPAVVQSAADLHSLGLDEVEDVALGGRRDVEPDTGHQTAERATAREVGAPPNVQPLPQHLHCKESHGLHLPQYTSNMSQKMSLKQRQRCSLILTYFG